MTPSIDRLYDLLADRATHGLTPGETAELAALQKKWPHVEDDLLDLTAAALAVADAGAGTLPPHLAAAILGERPVPRRQTWSRSAVAGWVTAAAVAGLLLWSNRPPAPPQTLEQRRDALRATGVAYTSAGGQPTAVVVWDSAKREGVLEVRGLPGNDPKRSQYQLWVVDAGRGKPGQPDPNNRVDGGVFDVRPDGTALVAIRPALAVFQASAFVITEEPPGGVIVSRATDNVRAVLSAAAD